jgi:hypothetical protein
MILVIYNQTIKALTVSVIAMLFFTLSSHSQYYWVGGTGNWSDYATHWATSSGGSSFHTQAPTVDDDVYFNANSFTSTGQVVTMNVTNSTCRSMDWTGVLNNPTFESANFDVLRVYGSVTLGADMLCNIGIIEFWSSNPATMITSQGTSFGNSAIIRFQGTGVYELADNLEADAIQMQQGTFKTNGNSFTLDFSFTLNGASSKTVDFGNSNLYMQQWRTWGSNNNILPGTYTIHTSSFYADEEDTGPYTYNNLVFLENGAILEGNGIYNVIDINGTAGEFIKIESGKTITCNQFLGTGTRHNPLEILTTVTGQAATIEKTSGTVDLDFVILADVHAEGGATFNATNCLDLGNNAGWNITDIVALPFYWVGNGGDWDDVSHWATTSGGATSYNDIPSRFDDVYIDANSISNGGQTITVTVSVEMRNLDCTGAANTPTLNAPYGNPMQIFGYVNMTDGVNKTINNIDFVGYGALDVDLGTMGNVSYPSFWGSGSWTLQSDVSCATFAMYKGSVDLNGYDVTCGIDFKEGNFNASTYFLGSGNIYCRDFIIQSSNATINSETANIHCRRDFKGQGFSYYHLTLLEEGSIYQSNEFEILEFAPGVLSKIEANSTQTINQSLLAEGTPSLPVSISSTQSGVQATFNKSSGVVDALYVILQDNNATGGATFNATQAVNNGNNTGWNITEIVPNDFYWVGGTGSWSDAANHWAATSGGVDYFTFSPGPLDNVYFDANSFSAAGMTVTVDVPTINVHDMDWSGALNGPHFDANQETINVYGSLTFIPSMTASLYYINFLSTASETITPAFPDSPGFNSYLTFTGGGAWTVSGDLTCRELSLEAGTVNIDADLHVDFATYFLGEANKTLNVGSSNYYTRSMQWNTFGGSNLTVNAQNSDITCSGSFAPGNFGIGENVNLNFSNLHFGGNMSDIGAIQAEVVLETLSIEAGKEVEIFNEYVIVVDQLVAQGTTDDFIYLHGSSSGFQAGISQASGTVDGQYLELEDISGLGGATFYANNSLNLGNVSGWIFSGQAQSITFDPLVDVLEDVGTIALTGTASSGLTVNYEVVSGPATVAGSQLTITGPGPVEVQASQPGNIEFNPAPSVSHTFCSIPLQPEVNGTLMEISMILNSSSAVGNQWYLNGVEINGATDQNLEIFLNGTYTVQVNVGGCISDLSDEFVVIALSAPELTTNAIQVYPNPTTGILSFDLPRNSSNTQLRVYDSVGSLVETQQISGADGRSTLDFSHLASGMYLMKITSQDGEYQHTFIKK